MRIFFRNIFIGNITELVTYLAVVDIDTEVTALVKLVKLTYEFSYLLNYIIISYTFQSMMYIINCFIHNNHHIYLHILIISMELLIRLFLRSFQILVLFHKQNSYYNPNILMMISVFVALKYICLSLFKVIHRLQNSWRKIWLCYLHFVTLWFQIPKPFPLGDSIWITGLFFMLDICLLSLAPFLSLYEDFCPLH